MLKFSFFFKFSAIIIHHIEYLVDPEYTMCMFKQTDTCIVVIEMMRIFEIYFTSFLYKSLEKCQQFFRAYIKTFLDS